MKRTKDMKLDRIERLRHQGLSFCSAGLWRKGSKRLRRRPALTAADVVLQLLNRVSLDGNDPVHQISDRNQTDDLLVFDDRKVAHALSGDDFHAFIDSSIRFHSDDGTAHNFFSSCFLRR